MSTAPPHPSSEHPHDVMRASLAMFITLRDGRIASQRNYDCFEPF